MCTLPRRVQMSPTLGQNIL